MITNVIDKISDLRNHLGALFLQIRDRMIQVGITALDSNASQAQRFINSHSQIELIISEFQEECVVAIARYQPVARDLHSIMTLYRVAHDADRIACLTLSIAKKTLKISKEYQIKQYQRLINRVELINQINIIETMLRDCKRLITTTDHSLLDKVCQANDDAARVKRRFKETIDQEIVANPQHSGVLFYLFAISRHYDRIADLVSYICQELTSIKK